MGSIVYVDTGDSMAAFTRWLVIDGQQRLTTLTLLLAALRDRISKTGWHGNGDSPTVDRINSYFLINPLESGDRHRKLVLRRADDSTLDYLITGSKAPVDLSEPILNAYRLFSKLVASNDPDAIYQGIAKLIVVDVTLHHAVDNPQLVFESLNSTGVDLSQADLVRNYILMSLPEKEQTTLYDGYWSIIEGYFKGSGAQLDSFVRDYVAQETRITKQTRYDQIYRVFSPNPPMRSGLGVRTRGEGRGTRRFALDSDKWGWWRPLVVVGGADGGPGQRRWGGVGGTACRGRQSRTGPVRLCGSVG